MKTNLFNSIKNNKGKIILGVTAALLAGVIITLSKDDKEIPDIVDPNDFDDLDETEVEVVEETNE